MIRPTLLALALATTVAVAAPAAATDIFAGIHAHGVKTPLSLEGDRESGVDVSLGVRGSRIRGTVVQPYAFASLNSTGDTNFLAAGLSATFGKRFYVRPGLGIAVHDGSAGNFNRDDKLAFGSRILIEPELAIGATLSERASIEASWVHFSHAQVFGTQNPGIDNIGVRLNWRL